MLERKPRPVYFGHELEMDLLGSVRWPKVFLDAMKPFQRSGGYVPYEKMIQLIRAYYPEDPTNPKKEFTKDLRLEIMWALNLKDQQIRYYNSLKTPLDIWHGVDAWIEIDDPKSNEPIVVTIDTTLNTAKQESGHKANLIVGDVPEPDSKQYLPIVERYAKEAVELFQNQLHQITTRNLALMKSSPKKPHASFR